MKIFRSVLSGLAAFVCATSIVGLVYLFTLQETVMDRAVVKGWLSDSKIYENNLIASLVQPSSEPVQPSESPINPTTETIKTAQSATFPPDYVHQQVETVIDSSYDWIEGKAATFTFSIPIDQKRDTFIQQLAKALEPQIAALPICGTVGTQTCRPANITTEQRALQMTSQSINESGMFTTPITPASLSQGAQQPGAPSLSQLPHLRKTADLLFIILPIVIILSAAAAVYTMPSNRQIATAIRLSRRVFFSMLLTVITTVIVIFVLHNNYFDLSKIFAAKIGDIVVPLIKIIIIDIAAKLALFSGIASIVAAVIWAALRFIRQKNIGPQSPNISFRPPRP